VDAPVRPYFSVEWLKNGYGGSPVQMNTQKTHERWWGVTSMAGKENAETGDG